MEKKETDEVGSRGDISSNELRVFRIFEGKKLGARMMEDNFVEISKETVHVTVE